MSNLSTVALFLSQVERRSFAPANQSAFLDPEMLLIASEEFNSKILPAVIAAREEYYVFQLDQNFVADQKAYSIPDRSFNGIVREVQIKRSNQIIDLPRISLEDIDNDFSGYPHAFYPLGDDLVLYPVPSNSDDTLRIHYYLTPGELVEATDTAVISAINTTTKVITVTTIPSTWVTGDIFDFVSKSGSHSYKDVDLTNTLVSGTAITFSSLPSNLAVGDYVMPQGHSSLLQMPKTMIPVLAQYTAAAVLSYAGQPGGKEAEELADKLLKKVIDSLSPRITGEYELFSQDWF